MRYVRMLLARLRGLFAGHRADDDLREELESHLELETAELIRRGLDPETARRQARLASGGLTQAAESVRDQRGLPWIENTLADLRFGLRSLHRNPGFTAVVVLTLALGIGATTAIFSVVRGVVLKPLPHRDGDRLMYLRHSTDGLAGGNINFSVPEVRDLRTGAPAFAASRSTRCGTPRFRATPTRSPSTSVSSPATSSRSWASGRWSAGSPEPATTVRGSRP
jgi:putative ABC transport system permease protein